MNYEKFFFYLIKNSLRNGVSIDFKDNEKSNNISFTSIDDLSMEKIVIGYDTRVKAVKLQITTSLNNNVFFTVSSNLVYGQNRHKDEGSIEVEFCRFHKMTNEEFDIAKSFIKSFQETISKCSKKDILDLYNASENIEIEAYEILCEE